MVAALETVDRHRAAIAYAVRGWSVVPLHSPAGGRCSCGSRDCPAVGKHPRIRWRSDMVGAATVAEVAAWWRRWPTANVGIVAGHVSGLVVLDIDPRNGGDASLDRLEAQCGPLPETVESHTGGAGRHLWYGWPGDADGTLRPAPATAVLAPGLDRKGEGGIIVAPPSLHVSGGRYGWRPGAGPDERPLTACPRALVGPGHPAGQSERPAEPPVPRTALERRAFATAWAEAGIVLGEGEAYYRCPFHPDEHPSLHVDPTACRWYCFGCGRGGGIRRLLELLGGEVRRAGRARLRETVGPGRPVTLDGDGWVEVVGESHHQDELLALAGRRPYGGVELTAVAELVPEPANPADPEAIGVWIDRRQVGHLSRAEARRLRSTVAGVRSARGVATCRALVRGGWDRGRGDVGPFGVILRLPVGDRRCTADCRRARARRCIIRS